MKCTNIYCDRDLTSYQKKYCKACGYADIKGYRKGYSGKGGYQKGYAAGKKFAEKQKPNVRAHIRKNKKGSKKKFSSVRSHKRRKGNGK